MIWLVSQIRKLKIILLVAKKVLVLGGTGYLGSALIRQMNLEKIPHQSTTTHRNIDENGEEKKGVYLDFLDDLASKKALKILEKEEYSHIINLISQPKHTHLDSLSLRKICINSFSFAGTLAKKNNCPLLNFTTVHSKKVAPKNQYEKNHRLRNKLMSRERFLGNDFSNIVVPNVFGCFGADISRGKEYLLNSWINSAYSGDPIVVASLENQVREFMWIRDFTSEVMDMILGRKISQPEEWLTRNAIKLKFGEVLFALKTAFKECGRKEVEIFGGGYSNWMNDINSNSLNVRFMKQIICREIALRVQKNVPF